MEGNVSMTQVTQVHVRWLCLEVEHFGVAAIDPVQIVGVNTWNTAVRTYPHTLPPSHRRRKSHLLRLP